MTEATTPMGHHKLRDLLRSARASLDAVVLDVDGVLIRQRRPLPGASELLECLDQLELPYNLLTNDSGSSPAEKSSYLRAGGLEVREDRICSAGHALRWLVEARGLDGALFCVLGRLGVPDYAERAGLVATRDLDALDDAACMGVIVGEKDYDWETAVNAVVNYLVARPDACLVCPNPDLYYPVKDGRVRLSSGTVTHLILHLVQSLGRPLEPVYLGKPHEPLFAMNHALLEERSARPLERGRVLMVGDSLTGDIAGGRAFGYRTAVVLTGLTTPRLLAASSVAPDLVLGGL